MKTLKLFSTLVILFVFSFTSYAQKDFSEKLKKEIIKIEAGKFTAHNFLYLKFSNDNTMQVKISASCPVDLMSRDNFISIYSTYGTILLLATFSEAGVEIPDIKELDELTQITL